MKSNFSDDTKDLILSCAVDYFQETNKPASVKDIYAHLLKCDALQSIFNLNPSPLSPSSLGVLLSSPLALERSILTQEKARANIYLCCPKGDF